MVRHLLYFWWVDFQLKNWFDILATKYQLNFARIAKYWVDFLIQKISTRFLCELQNSYQIDFLFSTKYQAYICNSLMNQTFWSQGAYRLEIISTSSEKFGQLPIQILFWEINRLLIGVKPTSEICQYNRNQDSKHAQLLVFTFIHDQSFILTCILEVGLTPVSNWRNMSIPQNKICSCIGLSEWALIISNW